MNVCIWATGSWCGKGSVDVWEAEEPLRQEGRLSHLGTDSLFQRPGVDFTSFPRVDDDLH